MWFHSITAEYNGPLEAAQAHMNDDGYDIVRCGAAARPTMDLSYQLRGCGIASMYAISLSSSNVVS